MGQIDLSLNPLDWTGIEAIATALMFVINAFLLVTIIVGFRAIREEIKHRDSSLLIWAMEQMNRAKPDIRKVLGLGDYACGTVGTPDFDVAWDTETCASANRVTVTLQRLAYLAEATLISRKHLAAMWGPTFVDCWRKLEPYVQHRRHENGEPLTARDGAFSRRDFEIYAQYCARLLGVPQPA